MGYMGRFPFLTAVTKYSDTASLFSRSRLFHLGSLTGRPVMLLTSRPDTFRHGEAAFNRLGLEVAHTNYVDLALEALIEDPASWSAIAIRLSGEYHDVDISEFVRHVRTINPSLPIIILTDEIRPSQSTLGVSDYGDAILSENFTTEGLANKLAAVIGCKHS